MKQVLTNAQMALMRRQLEPALKQRNKIGYVAARNYRFLSNALTEYEQFRSDLLEKYGETKTKEDGSVEVSLAVNSDNFKTFCDELQPFNVISHEVELMTAKYEEAVDILSGEELLQLDWMFED